MEILEYQRFSLSVHTLWTMYNISRLATNYSSGNFLKADKLNTLLLW